MDAASTELFERFSAETRRHVDEVGAQTRSYFDEVKRALDILGRELPGLRGELEQLRSDMQESAVETRRHFDVSTEELRGHIQLVAEGHMGLDNRLSTVEERLSTLDAKVTSLEMRMERGFGGVRAELVHLRADLADLRHDLTQLRH